VSTAHEVTHLLFLDSFRLEEKIRRSLCLGISRPCSQRPDAGEIMAGMKPHAVLPLMALPLMAFQSAKQMPYTAVNDPEFIPASASTFLGEKDRLIGLTGGNVVKAYPAAILAQHGVVIDNLPTGPIAVTW
jgi:hypothetical protein